MRAKLNNQGGLWWKSKVYRDGDSQTKKRRKRQWRTPLAKVLVVMSPLVLKRAR